MYTIIRRGDCFRGTEKLIAIYSCPAFRPNINSLPWLYGAASHVLLGSIILLHWRTYVIYICDNLPHGSCKHTSVCKKTNHNIDVLDILSYLHCEEIFVVYQKHPLSLRHHSKSVIFNPISFRNIEICPRYISFSD